MYSGRREDEADHKLGDNVAADVRRRTTNSAALFLAGENIGGAEKSVRFLPPHPPWGVFL